MSASLSILLALSAASSPPAFDVEARRPFGLVAYNPSGRAGFVTLSEVVSSLDALLAEHTPYYALAPETDRIEAALEGRVDVMLEVGRLMERLAPTTPPELTLLLLYLPSATGPELEVTTWVFDTRRLLSLASESRGLSGDELYELEARAPAEAVPELVRERRPMLETRTLASRAAFDAHLRRLVLDVLRPELEARSAWESHGEIELHTDAAGLEILVDDRLVGTTPGGPVRLRRVSPGERRLSVRHPDFVAAEAAVSVAAGQLALIELQARPRDADRYAAARGVTFWTGAALGLLGASALVYALARSGEAEGQSCISTTGLCALRNEYVPLAGLPAAPVGGGLTALGLGLTGGVLLESEDELPWKSWLVSLGLGAATFGVAAAVGP